MAGADFDDEAVVTLASAACAAYGLHSFFAPGHASDFYMAAGTPVVEAETRWIGFGLGLAGIQGLVVASSTASQPAKRNLLKTLAAAWAVAAGVNLYYAGDGAGQMRKEVAYANAALGAALSAAAAWRVWGRGGTRRKP